MKRLLLWLLPALLPLAGYSHQHGMNISIDTDDEVVTDCSQVKVSFEDVKAVRAEEEISASKLDGLRVRASEHSGVHVAGWDQRGWSIKACKAAANATALNDIHVNLSGNELTARGAGEQAFVYFLIRAPKNAVLDVDATSGPVGLYDVSGTMKLRAQNGPLSVKRSSGTINASTVNGPISFAGGSGTVNLTAENGPISLKLDGTSWDGSLQASTQNGPLSLKIPHDYRSGVVAEANGHGPVSCRAEACRGAKRTFTDDDAENRRIELGSGPAVIHVSTNNGPLSIKERQ